MDNDISKRTVLVLLILTLVVSVVGTWTVLSMPKTVYKTVEIGPNPEGTASVYLDSEDSELPPMSTDGIASVNIVDQ